MSPMATPEKLNVVLFAGGRGAANISEALLRHNQINLNVVVNAYDDGLSTGMLRRVIPGMLGPSDVRKNIARLIPTGDRASRALRTLLEFRLPVSVEFESGMQSLREIVNGDIPPSLAEVEQSFQHLSYAQLRSMRAYCLLLLNYLSSSTAAAQVCDFRDCSFGNLLFAGCFLGAEKDFNSAVGDFCKFSEITG